MRIGLLLYGSLDTVSGGYLYDRQLVNHLRQQQIEVVLVSLPWSQYGRHLFHNFSASLFKKLRQLEVDILLQDELNHPSLFALNRRLKSCVSFPIISIVHHLRVQERWPRWQRWLYSLIEKRYLQTIDGFIFNSQTTKKTVFDLIGKSRPHVVAYPAGNRFEMVLTPNEAAARAQQPGPMRLLFVGNVIPRKGLHLLVAAVARIAEADWRLEVVGDTAVSPRYTQQIQQQILAAQLEHKITLHGRCDDAALQAWYAQSHLLVVPSEYEGFGIVYLEGMAFGLPAIASAAGATHELITQGENGFLVDVAETAVLTRHLLHLIQNRDDLAKMSQAALRRFQDHPTWDDSMQRITAFLKNFAGGGSP